MKLVDLGYLSEGSTRLTPAFIDQVKSLYNQGMSLAEIGQQVYHSSDKKAQQRVQKVLRIYYPERTPRRRYTDQQKQDVKMARDAGNSIKQIAQQVFGTETAADQVEQILRYWFADRPKQDQIYSAEQIALVKQLYDQQLSYKQIAKKVFDQDDREAQLKVSNILKRYYPDRSKRISFVPPAKITRAAEMFAAGQPLAVIAAELEVSRSGLAKRLEQLLNYQSEILPSHLENRERLSGKSNAEIQFFKTLSQTPGFPQLQFNVRLRREGRLYYNIDALDSNRKIAIEFFGSLWHADPARFPDAESVLPKTNLKVGDIWRKDKDKIQWLKLQGYLVLIVWEREWTTKNLRLSTVNGIRDAFGLSPVAAI